MSLLRSKLPPSNHLPKQAPELKDATQSTANARMLPQLDFGQDCKIFTRKRLRLRLRNHSAIPTTFNLAMRQFPTDASFEVTATGNGGNTLASLNASSSTRTGRKRLLDTGHEKTQQYFSRPGRTYITKKIHREEDKEILRSGRGTYATNHTRCSLFSDFTVGLWFCVRVQGALYGVVTRRPPNTASTSDV